MFRFMAKTSAGETVEGEVRARDAAEAAIEVHWLYGPFSVVLQVWPKAA
jgi:hypothetical protein